MTENSMRNFIFGVLVCFVSLACSEKPGESIPVTAAQPEIIEPAPRSMEAIADEFLVAYL